MVLLIQKYDRSEINPTPTSTMITRTPATPPGPAPHAMMIGKGQKKQPPAEFEVEEANKANIVPTRTSPKATINRGKRNGFVDNPESLQVSLKQE
jgi:hypothetical protein